MVFGLRFQIASTIHRSEIGREASSRLLQRVETHFLAESRHNGYSAIMRYLK